MNTPTLHDDVTPEVRTSSGKTQSVSEVITVELRRAILNGAIRPGEEFMLRETAKRFGVSTAPVRDAIRILQSEGLVHVKRARSAVVAPMDSKDLAAIYDLRRRIEPDIAARAAPVISEEQLAAAEALAATMRNETIADAYDNHRDLHAELLKPAATSWEMRMLDILWNASERYVRIGFGRLDLRPEEHERRSTSHQTLIDAFRSRDPEAARKAVCEHLTSNQQLAGKALDLPQ